MVALAAALALSLGGVASAQEAARGPSNDCPDADAEGTCLVGERHLLGSLATSVDYAGRSAALGLGYLQTSLRRASYDASQRADWHAYGVNGRVFLGGESEGARGWGALATGRLGAARRLGVSLELSAGAAGGAGGAFALAQAGVFATIYYVDLGYSFQAPIGADRPDWLGTHLLSLRAHLPFVQWGEGAWRSSAGWFPGS